MRKVITYPIRQTVSTIKRIVAYKIGLLSTTVTEADDIFIVGYPKSGNTWMQNMTAAIMYGLNLEWASYQLINDLVPDINNKYNYYRRHHSPMYFKTHAQPTPQFKRVVYLVRDGRDAIVSYYHHQQNVGKPATMAELSLNQGAANIPYGTWYEHVTAWLDNPYQADMMILRYEDLKRNTVAELQRFCEFAGFERDEAFLESVANMASFSNMRQREDKYGIHITGWQHQANTHFVRKGKIGGYQDEMPQEVLERFMKVAGDTLKQLNYL